MSIPVSVVENIERVRERMEAAAHRSGRNPSEIALMAVSKFHGLSEVKQAYQEGIRLFGESRVQEARDKFSAYKEEVPDIDLHLIGSLQRNKAKSAVDLFSCIQSADRDELIVELARHAAALGRKLDILLELHTGEESKSGYDGFDLLRGAAELVLSSPSLTLRGLMTMAPYTADSLPIRASFRALRSAGERLKSLYPDADLGILSMGMTNDFETAIEEGSTLIRVGTAIFGPRSGGDV
ncbi:MAG: YggS family pyridoxal phosphate-dependent enzyme [Treponemataceae bacterium]